MAREGSVSGRLARHAGGCLAYFLLFVGLAWGLDAIALAGIDEDLRPWAGIAAAVFLTLGLGSLWGIVTGYAKWNPKGELLAATATGALPAEDGQVLATGTAKPAGLPLVAPISGTECVAYAYNMHYLSSKYDVDGHGMRRPSKVPVYWGQASKPFTVHSPRCAVRINAVPRLVDEPKVLEGEEALARARAFVRATRFERVDGLAGALGTAVTMLDDMLTDDDAQCRRDWTHGGEPRDPGTLILEETVLPVGATISVVGPWSASRRAIVPHAEGDESVGVTATAGRVGKLLSEGGVARPSILSALAFAIVTSAIGGAIIWAAIHY
ncbi:MAG TPA: hypothetical protein PLO00_00550 [Usitatibacteraceae bacterium]|nr:hypothetical protein [Usitatibacteraceae bacterium]HQY46905.1 hypothetical protein [Usitatibacteraceae bacterium]